ncbi:hypothetical protein SAMN05421678_10996 [Actinopolymorpha cephalotaxi]|uniref:Pyruvate/2-oxoglutarate dehydrogenase complex dihydrolipoamide acyltransferase (E2) component n=1 Tax=Actinopolymorpha cephalotaxi TaxID=504797 RepID=A0A1I2VCY0_9ACTN|nr:hypothetical protein [Actinopolymorpha cephalotaxi]NYH84810.1 pyruvate/2-oxoglutarate dehydrogenase complex dihydrolipoamide acyltransferase (E2) component [Actinopolymorpha cephalotaxi]SFG86309.1 hypothetical protein SAMN05421678_10996 [Actinopolymorpha cephalotaxi]
MKLANAALAVLAAVITGVGGGAGAAQVANAHDQKAAHSPPSTTPTPSTPTARKTTTPKPTQSATPKPQDALSEENVVRERLYFDVTGHSFTRTEPDPAQTLSPCTGEKKFSDVLPSSGVTRISSQLVDPFHTGHQVVEQVAQTRTAREARATADRIVTLVDECAAISGGDFGYGAAVTVESKLNVTYFPAYDSDTPAGGYIVFSVGTRVGFVDVADNVTEAEVDHLAKEAANIAAD